MMAMGATEMVFLFLSLISGNDLLSMVDGNDYFKSRKIPVTIEKMVELATTQANSSKDQVAQLLALRMLAEDADEVKKTKNFNDILKNIEEVAQGKKAADLQGFAAEYARRTAIALGSKLEPVKNKIPENSIRQDALNWFPKDVTLVVSQDFRFEVDPTGKQAKEMRQKIMKMIPPEFKEPIYSTVEQLGNIQMERFSLGYTENPQNIQQGKIYIRVSGKINHKQAVAYIKKIAPPNYQFKETKSFRGKPITMMWTKENPPGIALIGDTDLILAGQETNFGLGDPLKILDEMLEVQRGKQPSVLTGPLAEKLKKISPTAAGMVIGQVPENMGKSFTGGGGPPIGFRTFPKDVVIEMNFKGNELKLQLQSEMANANDAKNFADDTNNLVQLGLAAMQNPPPFPPNFPNPAKMLKGATDLLKSIKIETKGQSLTGSMAIGKDLIDSYVDFGMAFFGLRGFGGPLPPPQPKIEKKKEANEVEKKIKESRLNLDKLPHFEGVSPVLEPLTLEGNVVACWHGETRNPPTSISA